METRSLSDKKAFLVLCAFLVLALLPVFLLAFYAYPSADDLSYGITTAHAWEESHSVASVLSAAWQGAMEKYQTWQGSFFAVFLMYLQPAVFGTSFYALGVVALLISYLASTSLLVYTVCRRVFLCDRVAAGLAALTVLLLSLLFTYDPVEAFFWYNGGIYYTFFYSVSLLLFSLLILSVSVSQKAASLVFFLLSLPLAFFLGGGNYSTALFSSVLLFLLAILMVWKRRGREAVQLFLVFAALMASFAVNILAPGNFDPTPYLTAGMVSVPSDAAGYRYRAAQPIQTELPTVPATGEPSVDTGSLSDLGEEELAELADAGSGQPPQPAAFRSDTTYDFAVHGAYQFRITSLNGAVPVMKVDNANFRVELALQEGNDYFFMIYAQAAAGEKSTVSVNGVKLLTATVA